MKRIITSVGLKAVRNTGTSADELSKRYGTKLVIHPGSAAFVAKCLNVRFPNIRFVVPDDSDKYIFAGPVSEHNRDLIEDAISVLTIAWTEAKDGGCGE